MLKKKFVQQILKSRIILQNDGESSHEKISSLVTSFKIILEKNKLTAIKFYANSTLIIFLYSFQSSTALRPCRSNHALHRCTL